MASRSALYLAIGLAALAAILAVHVGEGARYAVLAAAVALATWSLRRPAIGLVAALPLVYMINPTPTTVGWREFGFAITISTAGLSSIWHHRLMLAGLPRSAYVWMSVVVGWFVLNFLTALWSGVSVADWVRGAAPFVFLGYLLPVWLEAKSNLAFEHAWRWAAGIAAALFSWHVLQVYVGEQLWKPATYIFDNGAWVSMGYAEAQALGKQIFEFAIRVTQRLQQATDTLLCLGVVWGAWASLWLNNGLQRMLGLGLSVLSTTAIVLTYTRSMLLSSLLVTLALMLVAVWRGGRARRVSALFLALLVASTATIVGFNLEPIYLNRLVQMGEQAGFSLLPGPVASEGSEGREPSPARASPGVSSQAMVMQSGAPPAAVEPSPAHSPSAELQSGVLQESDSTVTSQPLGAVSDSGGRGAGIGMSDAGVPELDPRQHLKQGQPKDANIASRVEEYRIAWDRFRASPLFGHGLGIQHNIRFDAGNGEWLDTRVGYVHNWIMYVLMTGGLLGLMAYAGVLFGPAVLAWRRYPAESGLRELVLASIAVMAIYGLFFAVFRLIPFNLVLGGMWGLMLSVQREHARE